MSSYDLPISLFPQTGSPSYRTGHNEGFGEPNIQLCPPEGIPPDGTRFEQCSLSTGFSQTYTFSFADMAQEVKDNAIRDGAHPPDYCTFQVALTFGSVGPAFVGCVDPRGQDESNGWCGNHDWGGTDSFLSVRGGTDQWIAPHDHDYGFVNATVEGIGPSSLGADQGPGTWQQGIWWAVSFEGHVVNPNPPNEIPIPTNAWSGPDSYGGRLLFPIDEPPPDLVVSHNVSGSNFPAFTWSVTAVGYYDNAPTPPRPPCHHTNWSWSTPIDVWEDWDPSRVDGRSDVDNHSLSIPSGAVSVDDLLIVTMMMYMPSGDTPYLTLGRWPGGSPGFIDETSEWTALPGFRAHDIYVRSWWKRADLDTINDGTVAVNLYNFDAPYGNTTPGSTEGGVLFLNMFQSHDDPSIFYQRGSTSNKVVTPVPSSGLVMHQFFARRPNDPDHSVHGVTIHIPSLTTGVLEGTGSGSGHNGWMTAVLEDNRVRNVSSGFWEDQDFYAVGFFCDPGFGIPGYDGHAEKVTWDLSDPGPFELAYGPAGAVQQGIQICSGTGVTDPVIIFV